MSLLGKLPRHSDRPRVGERAKLHSESAVDIPASSPKQAASSSRPSSRGMLCRPNSQSFLPSHPSTPKRSERHTHGGGFGFRMDADIDSMFESSTAQSRFSQTSGTVPRRRHLTDASEPREVRRSSNSDQHQNELELCMAAASQAPALSRTGSRAGLASPKSQPTLSERLRKQNERRKQESEAKKDGDDPHSRRTMDSVFPDVAEHSDAEPSSPATSSGFRLKLHRGRDEGAEQDDLASTASTSASSPQAATMLLKALQRRRRNLPSEKEEPDAPGFGMEESPRSPTENDDHKLTSGGHDASPRNHAAPPAVRAARALRERPERLERPRLSGVLSALRQTEGEDAALHTPGHSSEEADKFEKPPLASLLAARRKLNAIVNTDRLSDQDDCGKVAALLKDHNFSSDDNETPSLASILKGRGRRKSEPKNESGHCGDEEESSLLARRRAGRPGLASLMIEKVEKTKEPVAIKPLGKAEKIYDLYYWNEVIQEEGCGGKVVICSPKEFPGDRSPLSSPGGGQSSSPPGTHVMKIKSKADLQKHHSEDQFRKAHLKMLNLPPHVGVLPLHEVLEDDTFYYVVMEKATGGTLLCSLLQEFTDGIMPERAVKKLMREILSAINHIHQQGILHRDIKPDNLVVQIEDEPTSPGGKVRKVKLIDFDIADPDWCPMSPGKISTWSGTLRNSAPETFRGVFSQRSDLYSVGVVLYLLMAGRQPYADSLFDAATPDYDNLEELYENMLENPIDWDEPCWTNHPICRDFCMQLLAFDPDLRPVSAQEAVNHEWFSSS